MAVRGAQAEIQATRNCQAVDIWAWEKKKSNACTEYEYVQEGIHAYIQGYDYEHVW